MIVAIDESGTPSIGSSRSVVYVAVHLRQHRMMLREKQRAFLAWESSLPRSLKDAKGEFKGSVLEDTQLAEFAHHLLQPDPVVRITPVILRPLDNPQPVVEKHRSLQVAGIRRGVDMYTQRDRPRMRQLYEEFWHWVENLSYDQYLKVILLGTCIHSALVNSFGHAIAGGYEDELTCLRYVVDRDFLRQDRTRVFWLELLRNQVWHASKTTPLPLLATWREDHPVVEAYTRRGRFDMNRLFVKRLEFVPSHETFEVRLADMVASILFRCLNEGTCAEAGRVVDRCLAGNGGIPRLVLADFDPETWMTDPGDNPWENPEAR